MQKLISVGQLFSKATDLYKASIKDLIQPIIIMIIPTLLMTLVMVVNIPGQMFIYALLTIANIIISLWIALVMIDVINKIYNKQPVNINDIYNADFKKIPSYLLIAILIGLIVLGGLILLIVPGIIFSIWYGFAIFIFLFEGTKGYAALKKSKELVVGYTWAILWRLILTTIVIYIIGFIVSYILTLPFGTNIQAYTTGLAYSVITTIVFTFIAPWITNIALLLFYDLKKIKAAAPAVPAAPVTPPPAPQV